MTVSQQQGGTIAEEETPVNHRSTLLARLFRMNVADLNAQDKAAAAQWTLQVRVGFSNMHGTQAAD